MILCNGKFCLSDEVWYFYWGTETGKHMKRNSKSFIFLNLAIFKTVENVVVRKIILHKNFD